MYQRLVSDRKGNRAKVEVSFKSWRKEKRTAQNAFNCIQTVIVTKTTRKRQRVNNEEKL